MQESHLSTTRLLDQHSQYTALLHAVLVSLDNLSGTFPT